MAITGSCHCGGTAFEIDGETPEKLTRCLAASSTAMLPPADLLVVLDQA